MFIKEFIDITCRINPITFVMTRNKKREIIGQIKKLDLLPRLSLRLLLQWSIIKTIEKEVLDGIRDFVFFIKINITNKVVDIIVILLINGE